jgi:hypothetical protein
MDTSPVRKYHNIDISDETRIESEFKTIFIRFTE